jgi:hypothetical protein
VICCSDALLLFSSAERDLFQPIPMLGTYGLYFFFIAPLLHVCHDYWFTSAVWAPADLPEDWRPWLGLMAFLNLFGLIVYKLFYKPFTRLFSSKRPPATQQLSPSAVRLFGPLFAAVTLSLQVYVYYRIGGISAFIESFGSQQKGQSSDFTGLGWLFNLASAFPVIIFITTSVLFRKYLQRMSFIGLAIYMTTMFVLAVFFGGLSGSRGNTVFTLIYLIGIFHLTVRPLSKKWLSGAAVATVLFMYFFGFYKANPQLLSDPITFLATMSSSEARTDLERKNHRNVDGLLLGDLGRSDVQAYLLRQMVRDESDIQHGYGKTYVDSIMSFIPYDILGYRPPGKLLFGTEAIYGSGTYSPTRFSQQIYGLAGETMLNFGPYSAPFGFVMLAAAVGYVRAATSRWSPLDCHQYLVPIMPIACILLLSSDLDNVIFLVLQHLLVPFVFIKCCSGSAARQRPEGTS